MILIPINRNPARKTFDIHHPESVIVLYITSNRIANNNPKAYSELIASTVIPGGAALILRAIGFFFHE